MDYAPTCFLIFHSSVFRNAGYFDEEYFVYCDDSDFMYKLKSKNIPIHFSSKITIEHKISSSTGGLDSKFTNYWVTRNLIILAYKNHKYFSTIPFLIYYFLRFFYQIVVFTNKKALFLGMVDGFLYILKNSRK